MLKCCKKFTKKNAFLPHLRERMEQRNASVASRRGPQSGHLLACIWIVGQIALVSKMLMIQMQAPARKWGYPAGIRSRHVGQAPAREEGNASVASRRTTREPTAKRQGYTFPGQPSSPFTASSRDSPSPRRTLALQPAFLPTSSSRQLSPIM